MNDVQGTYNFCGKKNEVLNISVMDADIANKNARQAFTKVPGIFVYDMDGSVNQINIGRSIFNNISNKQYFTKTPAFYPGPGVWPSEGRNLNVSFIVKI